MPMDRSRYPADWEAISLRIRFERAGGKCEWCGVGNGQLIVRSNADASRYLVINEDDMTHYTPDGAPVRLSELPEEFDGKWTRVVLTVHHIGVDKPDGTPGDPHDKMDVRDENLAALCQRCHFIADLPIHIEKARLTRAEKKQQRLEATGQMRLL